MKLINNPDRSQWAEILKRPVMNTENLFDTVRGIIDRVKSDGDRAVLEMEAKFTGGDGGGIERSGDAGG